MSVYDTGKLVKKLREQKGLSQDDLADGIIDRTGLSRIENGSQMPHMATLNALFERLGFSGQNVSHYLDSKAFSINDKKEKLDFYLRAFKTAEASEMLQILEADADFKKPIEQQYLLTTKAANIINKTKDTMDDVYDILMQAIKLTIPSYHEKYIKDYYLTKQEFRIINMISIVYYYKGDNDKSVDIMLKMKESLDNCCVDEIEKSELYPLLIYNLTKSLFDMNRNDEAVQMCDDGIKICISNDKLSMLPLIVLNKALSLFELGETQRAMKYILQSHYSCDMIGRDGTIEKVRKFVKEHYDIDLPIIEK